MIVKFHFKHEGGVPRGLSIPNNILFIYWNAKRDRINGMAQSLAFFLLFTFLSLNAITGILPIAQGEHWRWIFFVVAMVSFCFFLRPLFWKGPWATLLFAVMSTEGFEEYIDLCIQKMEQMIAPENIQVSFLPPKEIKNIRRELMTAGIIKQLIEESNQISNIYDTIDFIAENCEDISGFIIKEVKNAK